MCVNIEVIFITDDPLPNTIKGRMTTLVLSKCHCGLSAFKIPFDTASLPVSSSMCHCNSCRHSSGQMFINAVRSKGPPLTPDSDEHNQRPASLENLAAYKTSDHATRYFCKRCTAHFFFVEKTGDEANPLRYCVFVGTLAKVEGVTNIVRHIFVEDTLDGGLADHIRNIDGARIPRYIGEPGITKELPIGWRSGSLPAISDEDELEIYCHCKSNVFRVKRATEAKPPYLVQDAEGAPIKFFAAQCLCVDCRLSSGNSIQSWIIVPRSTVIDPSTSEPVNFENMEKRPKGLMQYQGSEGHFRENCSTCGATIFWWRTGGLNMDISAGLLDQEKVGARGQGWVSWSENISYTADAVDSRLHPSLADGVKATNAGV